MIVSVLREYFYNDFPAIVSIMAGCVLITSQMERRKGWRWRAILSFVVISVWMTLFTRAVDVPFFGGIAFPYSGMVKYIGLFLLNVAAVLFFSGAQFFPSLFAVTISYSLQHLCDRIMEIPRYTLTIPEFLDRMLLMLLMAAALTIYGRIAVWNKGDRRFNSFERLDSRILLLIAAVVMSMNIVLDLSVLSHISGNDQLLTDFHAVSAMVSFLVILVSMCHLRESDSQMRAEIAAQMLRSEQERFDQDKAIHDAINVKCHDIRHQIAALGEKGYQASLKEIGGLVNIYDTQVNSKNTALDVVLSNKSLACLNKDITLLCMADGRQLSFMDDADVYALFGNILDNAMEAVDTLADREQRLISLTVTVRDSFLVIEEENYYEGELLFSGGLPVTSKQDKANHGFGVQSIRMLTDKYEGDLQMDSSDSLFRLSILLPIPQSTQHAA
ncbi:MAG: sensor histidine kinase [Clostridia bacterium]|nr:sensor histidine kinase [Clostridia bacterium]